MRYIKQVLFKVDALIGSACIVEGDEVVRLTNKLRECNAVALKQVKAGDVGPVQMEDER